MVSLLSLSLMILTSISVRSMQQQQLKTATEDIFDDNELLTICDAEGDAFEADDIFRCQVYQFPCVLCRLERSYCGSGDPQPLPLPLRNSWHILNSIDAI